MALMDRLKQRRDKLQQQLDRWIARGFRGGGLPSDGAVAADPTSKETAKKVSEVADLNRIIAERETKDRDA